jgi:hypothetical protein
VGDDQAPAVTAAPEEIETGGTMAPDEDSMPDEAGPTGSVGAPSPTGSTDVPATTGATPTAPAVPADTTTGAPVTPAATGATGAGPTG